MAGLGTITNGVEHTHIGKPSPFFEANLPIAIARDRGGNDGHLSDRVVPLDPCQADARPRVTHQPRVLNVRGVPEIESALPIARGGDVQEECSLRWVVGKFRRDVEAVVKITQGVCLIEGEIVNLVRGGSRRGRKTIPHGTCPGIHSAVPGGIRSSKLDIVDIGTATWAILTTRRTIGIGLALDTLIPSANFKRCGQLVTHASRRIHPGLLEDNIVNARVRRAESSGYPEPAIVTTPDPDVSEGKVACSPQDDHRLIEYRASVHHEVEILEAHVAYILSDAKTINRVPCRLNQDRRRVPICVFPAEDRAPSGGGLGTVATAVAVHLVMELHIGFVARPTAHMHRDWSPHGASCLLDGSPRLVRAASTVIVAGGAIDVEVDGCAGLGKAKRQQGKYHQHLLRFCHGIPPAPSQSLGNTRKMLRPEGAH
ncbi:hypothetical protein HRbin30_03323 [bacterium HR30]|nr:hypothetical protein HRbin30_03323 [bacterium HR30]